MKWVLNKLPDESVVQSLVQQGRDLHPALARVLALRGIDTQAKARRYFRNKIDDLPDPFVMRDMAEGARRLARAIQDKEIIAIHGDYDVDGTTAVALLTAFLKKQGVSNTCYFVPSRFKDGYGLKRRGIDFAAGRGATLLIAVDCGITGVGEAQYAKELGLDLVICDHHLPGSGLPDAVAVIDPHRADCPYPNKDIAACTIAFKLAQATAMHLDQDPHAFHDLLEFVALALSLIHI